MNKENRYWKTSDFFLRALIMGSHSCVSCISFVRIMNWLQYILLFVNVVVWKIILKYLKEGFWCSFAYVWHIQKQILWMSRMWFWSEDTRWSEQHWETTLSAVRRCGAYSLCRAAWLWLPQRSKQAGGAIGLLLAKTRTTDVFAS